MVLRRPLSAFVLPAMVRLLALTAIASLGGCYFAPGGYPVRTDLAQRPLEASSPPGPYWVVQQPVVSFASDSALLDAEARNKLSVLAKAIRHELDYSIVNVVVRGHTDTVGSQTYNEHLGRRRAEAVRAYLVEEGVDRARVYVRSQGERWLAEPTADGVHAAANRRVEITFPRR